MTCAEIEELTGAYVLDAVTPEEREEIEAHLDSCPHCIQLIRELRATMDLLPLSVSQVDPPPQLKRRVLSAVQAVASASSDDTLSTLAVRPRQALPRSLPTTQRERERSVASARRRSSTRWVMPLLATAAVLFLLLSLGLATWNTSLQQQVTGLHSQVSGLQSQVSSAQANAVVVTTYAIKGTPAAPNVTGEATHYFGKGINVTIMTLHGLPALQNQQVYQGWELQGKQTKSVGLLNVESDGSATVNIAGDVKGNDAVAVSLESGPKATPNAPKGTVLALGKVV